MSCEHPKAVTKRYVGSTKSYQYCPDCLSTWGGEETAAKKTLLNDAARADVTELDEPERRS
jgi:hypothetical protein